MKKETNTLIKLTGINPFLFWCMPIFYGFIICFIRNDLITLFIMLSTLAVFYCSYHISTFKIKIREEDQDKDE